MQTSTAQDSNIHTERLRINNNADVVKQGSWQVESGFRYASTEVDFYRFSYLQSPSILQRYGIRKNFELRLKTTISSSFAINKGAFSTNYNNSGFEPIQIGTKISILKQKKYRPQIAILAEATAFPLASSIYSGDRIVPNLRFLFSQAINKNWTTGYNLGSFWNDQFFYTADIYLQKKWSNRHITSIEYAGQWAHPNEMRKTNMQLLYGSFGYYLAPTIICDAGLGRGIGNSPDYFFKLGISFTPLN